MHFTTDLLLRLYCCQSVSYSSVAVLGIGQPCTGNSGKYSCGMQNEHDVTVSRTQYCYTRPVLMNYCISVNTAVCESDILGWLLPALHLYQSHNFLEGARSSGFYLWLSPCIRPLCYTAGDCVCRASLATTLGPQGKAAWRQHLSRLRCPTVEGICSVRVAL